MNLAQKKKEVESLKAQIEATNFFYITDASTLDVEAVNKLRRICFERGVTYRVAKNTLIKRALEESEGDFSDLYDVLKGTSSIMFSETSNVPAKLLKEFRATFDKPILKGAYIDSDVFIGDDQIEPLSKLKSKEELIGEIITLLQSPAKNVVSALQSAGGNLAGILKTLSEKQE